MKKLQAAVIATPTEMRPFIGSFGHYLVQLVSLEPSVEPKIRGAIDDVFQDFSYIGDDPDLTKCYLDGISDALGVLRSNGIALLAISAIETVCNGEGQSIPNCQITHFFVVPLFGYFQVQIENAKIHRFTHACENAILDLYRNSKSGNQVALFLVPTAIQDKFYKNIPWCDVCCSNERVLFSTTPASVQLSEFQFTSDIVRLAIDDADILIKKGRPANAVDRLHTALHGYLKTECLKGSIAFEPRASIEVLFQLLREQHPRLKNLGIHQESMNKVLRSMAKIVNVINSIRDQHSLAHPNDVLLDSAEATLFANSVRTLLQYLENRLSSVS